MEQTLAAPSAQKHGWHWYVEWMGPHAAHFHGVQQVLFAGESPFQKIHVYKTHPFGKLLVLDGDPQSSEFDEDIYHEVLVHPALVTHPEPRSVLILGGGEGATLREVLRHPSVEKVIMVDIDQTVVDLCKKELPEYSKGAFEDPRVTVYYEDANRFLEKTAGTFDCVISDLTEPFPDSPSAGLLTAQFFSRVKSRMARDGVFAMQGSHAARGKNELHIRHVRTLKPIWNTVRPYRAFVPSFYTEWGFILASDRFDPLKLSAEEVDRKLSGFARNLRYYDGLIHQAIFTVTKELRSCLTDF